MAPPFLQMVQVGGLEPPTSGSTDQRSNQLSYTCKGSPASQPDARKLGRAYPFGKLAFAARKGLKTQSPGAGPGSEISAYRRGRSGARFPIRGEILLDGLQGRGRDLLHVLGQFLGLAGDALELRAHIRRALLDDFR